MIAVDGVLQRAPIAAIDVDERRYRAKYEVPPHTTPPEYLPDEEQV